jgi:hypothetical protein
MTRPPIRLIHSPPKSAHPLAFGLLLLGMPLVLVGSVEALSVGQPLPAVGLLATLCALVVIATHREMLFGDETSINGSIVVVACSLVAFRNSSWLVGPAVCGVVAGLHVAYFRDRLTSKILINASATGLSAVAGAGMLFILTPSGSSDLALIWSIPLAVGAYWVMNNLLIASVLASVTGGPLREQARALVCSESQLLIVGVLGGFAGLLLDDRVTLLGVFCLLGLLLLTDLTITSPRRRRSGERKRDSLLPMLRLLGGLASWGTAAVSVIKLPLSVSLAFGSVAGVVTIVMLVAVRVWRRLGTWEFGLALGVLVADLPVTATFVAGGAVAGSTEAWIGGLVIVGGCAAVSAWHAIRRREHSQVIDEPIDDDLLVTAAVELAMLDAVESGRPPR